MNFFQYISASLLTLSLFTNVNTDCMLTKKLARKFVNTKPLMATLNSRHMCKQLHLPDAEHNECLAAAIELFNSKNPANMRHALRIFDSFVISKRFYETSRFAAMQGIESDDHMVQIESLKLLTRLVLYDYAFTDSPDAAKKLITSKHSMVKAAANSLFDTLFTKNQGFSEGISAAIENGDIPLFRTLFKYGHGFNESIPTAINNMLQDGDRNLFLTLFKYGHGFKEGTATATFALKNKQKALSALILLNEIIEHNHGFGETLKTLPMCMSSSTEISDRSYELFNKILVLIRTSKNAQKSSNIKSDVASDNDNALKEFPHHVDQSNKE